MAVETKAPKGFNLDDVEHSFEINGTSGPITIKSDDTIITSTIVINKEAEDDSEITNKKAGDKLQGAKYNIYDMNHKLLKENIETDENGEIKVVLRYGKFIVEEVRPPEFYLLNPDEEKIKEAINNILEDWDKNELFIDKVKDYGKKRLAYEIRKEKEGYYLEIDFISKPEIIGELERKIRINDDVIKFITVKMEEGLCYYNKIIDNNSENEKEKLYYYNKYLGKENIKEDAEEEEL